MSIFDDIGSTTRNDELISSYLVEKQTHFVFCDKLVQSHHTNISFLCCLPCLRSFQSQIWEIFISFTPKTELKLSRMVFIHLL